jgi:hypothetical protein
MTGQKLHHRSGHFRKLDRDTDGDDSLQANAVNVSAFDAVDLKNEIDNRICVIVFRFADQGPDGRQAIGFSDWSVYGAPLGRRLDAAD